MLSIQSLIVPFRCLQLSGTGYAAAAHLWPDIFSGISGKYQAELMAGMRVARARLVSGFESMVMVRGPCGVPSSACRPAPGEQWQCRRSVSAGPHSYPCLVSEVCTYAEHQRTDHPSVSVPSCLWSRQARGRRRAMRGLHARCCGYLCVWNWR